MFHIDPNINTAVEIRAERLRALRAANYIPVPERFAPDWGAEDAGLSKRVRRGVTLALAAAVPVVLIVALVVTR